jgi:uncharacterized protein YbcC (UPF0753/DUF2309 family)
LHAFQSKKFHDALYEASAIFGYKTYLSLADFRKRFHNKEISEAVLDKIIVKSKGIANLNFWKEKLLKSNYDESVIPRIGSLRSNWKKYYAINLEKSTHSLLFRVLCSYLDQGIAIWNFPAGNNGFLASIKELEKNSLTSFFKNDRAKKLLLEDKCSLSELLEILVGNEESYEHYLFDQQFAHPGWSGIVSVIETNPKTLIDTKKITLKEFIQFELLLEIDALDSYFTDIWSPLCHKIKLNFEAVFDEVPQNEFFTVLSVLQDAYEWSYYDQVLNGIAKSNSIIQENHQRDFQAIFCIDDRECSVRRHRHNLWWEVR